MDCERLCERAGAWLAGAPLCSANVFPGRAENRRCNRPSPALARQPLRPWRRRLRGRGCGCIACRSECLAAESLTPRPSSSAPRRGTQVAPSPVSSCCSRLEPASCLAASAVRGRARWPALPASGKSGGLGVAVTKATAARAPSLGSVRFGVSATRAAQPKPKLDQGYFHHTHPGAWPGVERGGGGVGAIRRCCRLPARAWHSGPVPGFFARAAAQRHDPAAMPCTVM